MKVYKLTIEGRKKVKVMSRDREPVLDHLYENKTATLEELETIDKEARTVLRKYKSWVVEVQ